MRQLPSSSRASSSWWSCAPWARQTPRRGTSLGPRRREADLKQQGAWKKKPLIVDICRLCFCLGKFWKLLKVTKIQIYEHVTSIIVSIGSDWCAQVMVHIHYKMFQWPKFSPLSCTVAAVQQCCNGGLSRRGLWISRSKGWWLGAVLIWMFCLPTVLSN